MGDAAVIAELGLSISDAVIIVFAVGAGLKVLADYRGWTKSPALVRQENADLRERNATLQAEVERLDKADREKSQQIAALEGRVEELQKRDQAAVLQAIAAQDQGVLDIWKAARTNQESIQQLLRDHEVDADRRHAETLNVLREIRDGLQVHSP